MRHPDWDTLQAAWRILNIIREGDSEMRQRKQINEEILREIIIANEEEIELLGNNAEPLVDDSHEIEAAMREFEARQEYNDGVSAVCDID